MKLVIEKRTIPEFEEIERQIAENDKTFDQMHETWKILDDFFAQNFYESDSIWRVTYFRIYVRLTWKIIGGIADDTKFLDIIRRQVPMALLLDIDVLQEIMWYLGFNRSNKSKLISLYNKIKAAFFESEEIIGVWQGKNVTVKDLVSEFILLQKRGADSMEEAEFVNKLRQVMFPKEVIPFAYVDPDIGVNRFLELIEFFRQINNENVWLTLDIFLNPEQYQKQSEEESLDSSESAQPSGAPTASIEPAEPVVEPAIKKEEIVKPTDEQIKSQIELEFRKDGEGNFENIEGVMGRLSGLSEKYNDPSIAEMVYYDEEEGKFLWRV